MKSPRGFSSVAIVSIVIVVLLAGGIFFIYLHRPQGPFSGVSTLPDANLGLAAGDQSIHGILINFKLPAGTIEPAVVSTTQWLDNQGFQMGYSYVHSSTPSDIAYPRMYFSGTVSQLENSFHIQIYQYRIEGYICYAQNNVSPSIKNFYLTDGSLPIPVELANFIAGASLPECYRVHPLQ